MVRAAAAALALALAALAGCDEPPATSAPRAAADRPAGAVLAVDGRPILAQEIEAEAQRLAQAFPTRSERFLRSHALDSFLLPREALRSAYPERREEARAECAALRARLVAGADPFELGATEVTGGPARQTLQLWDAGRRLAEGEWSAPIERIGFFSLVQRVPTPGPQPARNADAITLRAIDVAYTPPDFDPAQMDAALRAARLEVLDPAWDDLVPERLRYQMRGGG